MSGGPELTLYTQVPDVLIERYGLTIACIYARIRRYAQRGPCTARVATIAASLNVNERTIRRAIEVLEAGGFIRVARSDGRPHVITLNERLQFAEPTDNGSVDVSGVTPDTMSAPTPDIMSAARTSPGHDVRTTSDLMSDQPRTPRPTTPDTMSASLKRQGKRQEQETSQETDEEDAGASARRPARKVTQPTDHQLMFQAICDAAGFEASLLDGTTAANVGKLARELRGKPHNATPDEVNACGEAWYSERWRGRARADVRPPSIAQLRTWFGQWRKAHATTASTASGKRDWGWGT